MSLFTMFSTIANKIGVSSYLLLSVCTVETNLRNVNNLNDPNGGSFGICQINLNTAKMLGGNHIDVLALQQVKFNIFLAAKYLKMLYNKYDNDWHAVAAYNAGSVRFTDEGLYINNNYVEKVKLTYEDYTSAY